MRDKSSITAGSEAGRSFEVRVPASTSNLGAGFDCFGLALKLYLTVRATVLPRGGAEFRARTLGEGAREESLTRAADNLIFRAMSFAAEREGLSLPPVRLAAHNEVPMGRGLGSSAAAIVAGIKLCSLVCGSEIRDEALLSYGLEMEGHADNVAASVGGGLAVTCTLEGGGVLAVKRPWPPALKLVVVSPGAALSTATARSALPPAVRREDAVHNLQRAALFCAALEAGDYESLWEATRDRLHQSHRQSLVPGLAEALATGRSQGLVGLALSGSGPSVVALALDRFVEIGEAVAGCFRRNGLPAAVRILEADGEGLKSRASVRAARTDLTW